MTLSDGHYAVVDRRGKVIARYSENRRARMRSAFLIDARVLYVSGRLHVAREGTPWVS